MADYRIIIKKSAAKEIDRIGSLHDRQRVVDRITGLSIDPRPHGVKKLVGISP